jgi:LytS/YehU family sensor histidine kinase
MKCEIFLTTKRSIPGIYEKLKMMFTSQKYRGLSESQGSRSARDFELFKMLLQPHFLFNSLNNLYALSVKESEQTSEAIAGLSELLEKVVVSARQDYIPLSEEVEMIKDYINLEKIWLGETSFCLDLRINGDLDRLALPPLVLYTFVENCFKHGIRKSAGDGWATIEIRTRNDRIHFIAKNSIPACFPYAETGDHNGLGVEAVNKILEKRCKGCYKLRSQLNDNDYTVELMIENVNNNE